MSTDRDAEIREIKLKIENLLVAAHVSALPQEATVAYLKELQALRPRYPMSIAMGKLDRLSAAVTVILGAPAGVAAWFDLSWIALVLGWAAGTLAGPLRMDC